MQKKLDLDFEQTNYVQYRLNLVDRNLISDHFDKDYMLRRYQQLSNLDLPTQAPKAQIQHRRDLENLEAGSRYYEIEDFYTKFNILKTLPMPADDVLLVKSKCASNSVSRWNNYSVCVNWYIHNWGTIYQYWDQDQLMDQFRPDDYTLWALDLEQDIQTINLDNIDQERIYISWLYKNRTLNQVLADWTYHNK